MNRTILKLVLPMVVVWLAGTFLQSASGASNIVVIARSGELTPGGNGVYQNFLEPKVNLGGTVTFNARLDGTDNDDLDDSGIYRTFLPASSVAPVITTLQEVIREGESYDIGGTEFTIADVYLTGTVLQDTPITNSVIPAAGQFSAMAIRLLVTDGNPDGNTIIAVEDDQGDLQLVAAAGDSVPGGDGTFGEFSRSVLSGISTNLGVSFGTGLENTSGGSDDNVGLYRYSANGSVQELVRKGSPTLAGTFTAVGGLRPNSFGGVVFSALNDSGDPDNDNTILRVSAQGSAPIRVVGEGDAAPSDDPDPREFSAVGDQRLNNNDSVGFSGRLRDAGTGFAVQNGSGLYRASSGGFITEFVREGELIPDGSARYQRFSSSFSGDVPRSPFNDLEQFAFVVRTNVEHNGGQSSGLFLASEGEIVQIALQGDSYEDGTFQGFRRDPLLNNQGLVVFDVELNVGTGIDDEGEFVITNQILVLTNGEDFATIAREGGEIGGRTVRQININNDPSGLANGLNDHGAVAFEVEYLDNSKAIVLWRPELGWQAASGDGNWDDAANWFFNIPPNLDSNVAIDTDTDSNVTGPGADTTVNAVSLGNGSGQVTLTFNGGNVATRDGTTIGINGSLVAPTGTVVTLTGPVANNGNIELGSNSELTIAGDYSGAGTIAGTGGLVVFQGGVSPGSD
ncbi:MAG: hypothetical protein QNJ40_26975 [Xanthomonadales bacterium]|nr:hypothetical protein [Xanthomonadales bacterium]